MTTGAGIASAPSHEPATPKGRPGDGAARERTEEYYARFGRVVRALCRSLLRDPADAEDATQQVFLSAHRALLNGSTPKEPAAWLVTIARNECWTRVRARMREPLASTDEEIESVSGDAAAEAARRADVAALWAAIHELPDQQRQALVLRELGGLTYDELAATLTVTTPAVESLLFRARRRLRSRLKDAYATLSGAPWIGSLVRLLAGSAPAVATKAVALGFGAAAVTGGAIVAPQVIHEAHPPPTHGAATTTRSAPRRVPRSVSAVPAAPLPIRYAPTPPPRAVDRHDDRKRGTEENSSVREGRGSSTGSSPRTIEGDTSTPTATTQESTDGGSSGTSDGGTTTTTAILTTTTDGGGRDGDGGISGSDG